jgi:putative membrane protein
MVMNIVLDCAGYFHMPNWEHMNWWGFTFFGLWLIGILIAIVVIVYIIIHSEKTEEIELMSYAKKILDERYAKGEISRKEYIQAKEDISDKNNKMK